MSSVPREKRIVKKDPPAKAEHDWIVHTIPHVFNQLGTKARLVNPCTCEQESQEMLEKKKVNRPKEQLSLFSRTVVVSEWNKQSLVQDGSRSVDKGTKHKHEDNIVTAENWGPEDARLSNRVCKVDTGRPQLGQKPIHHP